MTAFIHSVYISILALWVGGISRFTFIVTTKIFRSYDRDKAGEIVGKLFPTLSCALRRKENVRNASLVGNIHRSLLQWQAPNSAK